MMKVIIPLRDDDFALAAESMRFVVMVLQHHVHVTIAARPTLHAVHQLIDEMSVAIVEHRVHGVHAQAVEIELGQPVQRVLNKELTHDRMCEVDSTADRKSTRLNSSHSQISYAVFCL